jgi:hypothetical protein
MVAGRTLRTRLICLVIGVALAGGCSSTPPAPKVFVPPRIDLERFGTLGMIEFATPTSDGLGPLASREFLAAIHEAQPGTPVLELGDQRRLLAALSRDSLDPDTIRAICEKYRVDALIVGTLQSQRVEPNVSFDSAVQWMKASAELESGLDARILEGRSGATVWSTTAHARAELARFDISGASVSGMGANAPDDARRKLVKSLVDRATWDFWPRWE